MPSVQGDGELGPEPLVRAFSPAGPVLSRSRVGKTYISRIEARVTSCKALFFLQSLPWLATCNFHQFLAPRGESISAESNGTEGGRPMRDWMAFVTAVVVALLTRMLLA